MELERLLEIKDQETVWERLTRKTDADRRIIEEQAQVRLLREKARDQENNKMRERTWANQAQE